MSNIKSQEITSMKQLFRSSQLFLATTLLLLLNLNNAQAALDVTVVTSNINNLILQGDDLLVTIKGTTLTSTSMDSQLSAIETDVTNFQAEVVAIYDSIVVEAGTSLSLSDDLLVAFQGLSAVSSSLANATLELGIQIADLASITTTSTLSNSLSAMLRLSDDIGLMANRILEMADKILVMADNIGLMADRIIATQIIQSDNLKLVVDASLQTQTNTIQLIALFL